MELIQSILNQNKGNHTELTKQYKQNKVNQKYVFIVPMNIPQCLIPVLQGLQPKLHDQ